MPKPSAADLQKAAQAVDLDHFDYEVTLETSAGPIRLAFDAESAPGHVRNMVALAESGFYDGGCFHRIIKGFMIQGGCPQGTGTGGPGYTIPAEFNRTAHEPGVLSMARTSDPNSAGSQFFLCLEKVPHLDLPGVVVARLVKLRHRAGDALLQPLIPAVELHTRRAEEPLEKSGKGHRWVPGGRRERRAGSLRRS